MRTSVDGQVREIGELQVCSAHLEQEVQLWQRRSSEEEEPGQTDEALRSLSLELQNRLQLGAELEAALSESQRELQAAEDRVKVGLIFYLQHNHP